MEIKKKYANSNAYSGSRSLSSILAIVIHNTGNNNDTAWANANYFEKENKRKAGAHFFVDQKGEVYKSVRMGNIANSVGGSRYSDYKKTGGARFYGTYNNKNTVSIELCDIVSKDPSEAMIKSTKALIKYIRKNCPNAKTVIRHFDVNGKDCPQRFLSTNKWNNLLEKLGERGSKIKTPVASTKNNTTPNTLTKFLVRVSVDGLNIRKGPGTQYESVGKVNTGEVFTIVNTSKDGWGKLKSGAGWIKITDKYVDRV